MAYKYRIKEVAAKRAIPHVVSDVSAICDVTFTTASRWLNLHCGDKSDIPGMALLKISQYLKTPVNQLYNEQLTELSHNYINNVSTSAQQEKGEEVSGLS